MNKSYETLSKEYKAKFPRLDQIRNLVTFGHKYIDCLSIVIDDRKTNGVKPLDIHTEAKLKPKLIAENIAQHYKFVKPLAVICNVLVKDNLNKYIIAGHPQEVHLFAFLLDLFHTNYNRIVEHELKSYKEKTAKIRRQNRKGAKHKKPIHATKYVNTRRNELYDWCISFMIDSSRHNQMEIERMKLKRLRNYYERKENP